MSAGRFIKFPAQVRPTRVTPSVVRVNKLLASPVTNAQQVARRGNPAWRWVFEFTDLSEDERDVVQAFVSRCDGAANYFRVQDPAYYDPSSYVQDFADVFSGHGSFDTTAGSQDTWVNSYFEGSARYTSHITEDGDLRLAWRDLQTAGLVFNNSSGDGDGFLRDLKPGAAYAQRVKFFQNPIRDTVHIALTVGSGTGSSAFGGGPETTVFSSDNITVPFWTHANTLWTSVNNRGPQTARVGDHWHLADYRLARCALVCNSENLVSNSNRFSSGWSLSRTSVVSGFGADPSGLDNSWVLYVNTTDSGVHYMSQNVTKVATEDIYTWSVYARKKDYTKIRLYMDDTDSTDSALANFDLDSGVADADPDVSGTFARPFASIYDVGSGWYRCRLTAVVNAEASLRALCYIVNSDDTTSFSGVRSAGVEVYGAQLRKFPFMGHYCETTTAAMVGTGYQSGRSLIVDGLDPGQRVRLNARAEVVNRFYNVNSEVFERSELKRVNEEVTAHAEGWAVLPVDPPIRNEPVPGASVALGTNYTMHNPVIFDQPEMTARLVAGSVQEVEKPLRMYDVTFEVLEDLTE